MAEDKVNIVLDIGFYFETYVIGNVQKRRVQRRFDLDWECRLMKEMRGMPNWPGGKCENGGSTFWESKDMFMLERVVFRRRAHTQWNQLDMFIPLNINKRLGVITEEWFNLFYFHRVVYFQWLWNFEKPPIFGKQYYGKIKHHSWKLRFQKISYSKALWRISLFIRISKSKQKFQQELLALIELQFFSSSKDYKNVRKGSNFTRS